MSDVDQSKRKSVKVVQEIVLSTVGVIRIVAPAGTIPIVAICADDASLVVDVVAAPISISRNKEQSWWDKFFGVDDPA